jgi:hypothetical protein
LQIQEEYTFTYLSGHIEYRSEACHELLALPPQVLRSGAPRWCSAVAGWVVCRVGGMLNSKRSATERGNQRLALTKSHRLNLIPFNRATLAVAVLHSRIPRGTVPSRPASFVRCKSIPASIVYSSRYFRTLNQDQCFFLEIQDNI